MKLSDIAKALHCQVSGNADLEISGLATIEDAQSSELTFLSNKKYLSHLSTTQAGAVIIHDAALLPESLSGIISPNPYLTFAEALLLFHPAKKIAPGISPQAVIDASAKIGAGVSIGAFTTIGENVSIGDGVVISSHCAIYEEAVIGAGSFLHTHCVVRERCHLGERVILQNNVVIGSDGFGYAQRGDKSWQKIPQTGRVIIEDDVEIGAGSTIDRATLGASIVRRGAKIDNQVQIGHGSSVGEHTLLCAQVGLAGSSHIGNQVILSGQVGVAGHLKIGDRVVATAQTGIPNSVEPDTIISGYPAIANRDWLKSSAVFAKLPKLAAELRELRQKLRRLEDWMQIHGEDHRSRE
jgi:UDP-3-O-[3-hydroxymyristoyl] glucosamine N-acyltransferase